MRVKDLPPLPLVVVDPGTSLAEVARRMRRHDSDSVAVMEEGRLVGIVTERNLVGAIADLVDPGQVSAKVLMAADPATVTANEDVAMVAAKMVALGVRHLTVVDEQGLPVGLLSARNLAMALDWGGAPSD
jgi:CBS domain-containing protein